MQRPDPDDEVEPPRSRPTSRRNSASSRRSSFQKDREVRKKSPLNIAPSSANSTPKKQVKQQNLDFCVTGKKILSKGDRANSLPGSRDQRRSSVETIKARRTQEETKKISVQSQSSKSQETSLEDDMSLDLSQVSDFEDTNSKYGVQKKYAALATSTPKGAVRSSLQKPRSASLQSQLHFQKVEHRRASQKIESRPGTNNTFCSRDSLPYKSSSSAASNYRYGPSTELDYSSVSPEYSGQSSTDLSPRNFTRETDMAISPRSQELHVSSCCISSWQDCSDDAENTKVEDYRRADTGEWNNFWANYNNSIAKVPMKSYYDQCPTPYRTEDIHLADFDFSATSSRKRSPDNLKNVNNIIRDEGLHLTPRETQNIIKCAHILGSVLSKAIERRSKEKDLEKEEEKEVNIEELVEKADKSNEQTEEKQDNATAESVQSLPNEDVKEIKKKTLTLNLKETVMPLEVKEEKRQETVTTQTDISLPNTKSAPRIFEKILRQLSKSSLEESLEKLEKKALESKELERKALESREMKKKELENMDSERDKEENDNTELAENITL